MQKSTFLKSIEIDDSWKEFLTDGNIEEIIKIEEELSSEIDIKGDLLCPSYNLVLRFLNVPIDNIKVIILGQDPYPQKEVATGRAFEVSGITSWKTKFKNPSLQNIIRSAFKATTGKILKYSEIRSLLDNSIDISAPNKIFTKWEEQGVLLLNTALTCKFDSPGSHSDIWLAFTNKLLEFINNKVPNAYWFIWGNHALNSIQNINPENVLFSYHPSRCNERDDDFLYGERNCFKETDHLINWLDYKELPTLF